MMCLHYRTPFQLLFCNINLENVKGLRITKQNLNTKSYKIYKLCPCTSMLSAFGVFKFSRIKLGVHAVKKQSTSFSEKFPADLLKGGFSEEICNCME